MMSSVLNAEVDKIALDCGPISFPVNAGRVELKNKFELLSIKDTIRKPILRLGKEYYIIDTNVYYHYKEA